MRVTLWDEAERVPTMWCTQCRKRTLFNFDMDGARICRECAEGESHV